MRQREASFLSLQDMCVCVSQAVCVWLCSLVVLVADGCVRLCPSFVYFMYSPIYLCLLVCNAWC